MFLSMLRNTIPRTQLESGHGEAELGIFSAMSYLVIVGSTVVMAMSQSSISRLAKAHAAGDAAQFRRLVGHLVRLGLGLGLAGVVVTKLGGRLLLTTLYSPEYAQHQDVFLVIMIGGGVLYLGSLLGAPSTATKAYREQLWIQGVTVLVLIVAGMKLIPAHGMMGAAWTMVAGALCTTAGYGAVVVRAVRRLERSGSRS
jgi:O-antigen/teichoic acid export membrane protein